MTSLPAVFTTSSILSLYSKCFGSLIVVFVVKMDKLLYPVCESNPLVYLDITIGNEFGKFHCKIIIQK